MEEWVGGIWHRLVTRAAGGHYPAAAVRLADVERRLGVLYRGFGGDPGRRLGGAAEDRHGARRRWLSRLAGSNERVALAQVEPGALRLPAVIDCFPDATLNADLYRWLAALAGCDVAPQAPWFVRNQAAAAAALDRFPGLAPRYHRLVDAHLATRIDPAALPPDEAARETAIRAALRDPGSVADWPAAGPRAQPPQPVLLWLSPLAAAADHAAITDTADSALPPPADPVAEVRERALNSERVAPPQPKSPFLMMFRAESLLTWGEYLNVNRAFDDDPDPHAGDVARDLDRLSLARGDQGAKTRVKFDLDLPSAAADDLRLGDGLPLPEWDYRRSVLRPGHVRLQPMRARDAAPAPLPPHLTQPARRLRDRFAALAGGRRWQRGQADGEAIDLDAAIRHFADRRAGQMPDGGVYAARRPQERNLACLLLCDLSMSTDAWASNTHRVIDVVRDATYLFCEALTATGDAFGVYGFSSVRRGHVRFHVVKDFASRYDAAARGRIAAMKPGFYTRMGAALRQATRVLAEQPAQRRLLLLLSDGKPNDLDEYDSRYGIEDTRHAVQEARRLGLTPFCVTIDRDGGAYLPHLFGRSGYQVVTDPATLPARLPGLYALLAQSA